MKSSHHRIKVVTLVLALAGCAPESFDESAPPELASTAQALVANRVLILAPTVVSGLSSQEAASAARLGFTIEVVTPTQWAAKTAADFGTYRAIILGDPSCGSLTAVSAAVNNRGNWGSAVNGNVIIAGTSPVFFTRGPGPLTFDAVAFAAAQPDKTGAYISLSCYYANAAPGTPVPLLEPFGAFTVSRTSTCYNDVHVVAAHPALADINDANLSNWGCSVKEVFDSFPAANFAPLVIARDPSETSRFPSSIDIPDGSHGPAYVLARGVTPARCGNGVVETPESCDRGSQNGIYGSPCSSACRLNWCGDGVLDPGEQCDLGSENGAGTCSSFCRTFVTNRPPEARCRALTLAAGAACGASGSIDNGSFDPDNNLAGCTQSPAGPWGPGTTNVTLTCRDAAGLTSSCSAVVTVSDVTPPTLTCPANRTAECTATLARVDLGSASASDNCGVVSTTGPGPRDYALGTTDVAFSATDPSGNTSTCNAQVTVVDTLPPVITLNGSAAAALECGVDTYAEPGATANDQCFGDVSQTLTASGSVNTRTPGVYSVTYSAADVNGRTATATREVVVADRLAPIIALNGSASVSLECGVEAYAEAGATAIDACSGDLTGRLQIDASRVNPSAPGSYAVAYSVRDGAENAASASRAVTVRDTLPPLIVCPAPVSAECVAGGAFVDPGPSVATDACALASVTPNQVNSFPLGATAVAYTATDQAGHSMTCATSVTVADTAAPHLELNGAPAQAVECGIGSYVEAGATATDTCAGDLSANVTVSGSVNAARPGSYAVSYAVADQSGNRAATTRTVSVEDHTPPEITLLGSANVVMNCGASLWTDPGAIATDACSGDLTGSIVKRGSVDPKRPGQYTLTYDVTDGAGLAAATQKRTVQVIGAVPEITVRPVDWVWPVDHGYVSFHLSDCASTHVTCGSVSDIDVIGRITSIYSDEPEDAPTGDGNTLDDIVITGRSSFQLRSERMGNGNGRVYGVNFVVTDEAGNAVNGICRFHVRHSSSEYTAVDDGPAAGYTVVAR